MFVGIVSNLNNLLLLLLLTEADPKVRLSERKFGDKVGW